MARIGKQAAVKPRKAQRSIGRPSDPAHIVGRDALVAAACELLKTMPPNEVSGVKIARQCSADPSLIRYYFKDRMGLLTAAAEKLTTEFNPGAAVQAAGARASDQFRARMGRLLELDSANPFFHRLMLEELMPSDEAPAKELVANLAHRGVAAYNNILAHGHETGELGQVNPEMLFVSIVGICQSFDNAYRLYEVATGRTLAREEFLDQYKKFIGELLLNGVAARPISPAKAITL
jgi:AcrR family transcriptional regulator